MKVILIILDGWGISLKSEGNAVAMAKLPFFQEIELNFPFCLLKASGIAVGLPWGEQGNSEVGHLTLGSGRVILQTMPRIIEAIRDSSFFQNPALLEAVENAKTYNSQLHFVGLLGSGSVHSYIDHLYGLLELARRHALSSRVKLHLFTDGKDSPPVEGAKLVAHLNMRLDKTGQGEIATVIGRNFAMDRDYNWEKTQAAFNLLVKGEGQKRDDEVAALEEYYKKGINDDDIPPTLFVRDGGVPRGLISPHDSVVFFNYREDSARQLAKAFVLPEKVGFNSEVPSGVVFVTMTEYDKDFPCPVAFKPLVINHTLGEVLSRHKKTQFHIAETQKYAHVTYFFNGMHEERLAGEDWKLIPSFDTVDFVSKPELKAPEITQELVEVLEKGSYDFILANFANPDLIAHTGNLTSTISACETVDHALKELYHALEGARGESYTLIITADHGHAETMLDPVSGEPLTEHTSNDVPFYLISPLSKKARSPLEIFGKKRSAAGTLADVAPTVLELFGIQKPQEMTGKSLLPSLFSS